MTMNSFGNHHNNHQQHSNKQNTDTGLSLNLAVVGSKGAGKSAITVRFLTRRFIGEYASQADVCINRNIDVAGRIADVHVKDTNACDWLKGPSALIGWSTAIAIIYSVTDKKSFELATYILSELNITKRLEADNVLLLANKCDLEHLRQVSRDKGKELAMKYGTQFYETSAANDLNGVQHAFERLLFSALSSQECKVQFNNYTEQTFPVQQRKCNRVQRDFRRDNSTRSNKQLRRMSTGSHSSSVDTMSTISDDDRFYAFNIDSSHSSTFSTPDQSPTTSPVPSAGRRKISLPVLLEKMGLTSSSSSNHQHSSRKVSMAPRIR